MDNQILVLGAIGLFLWYNQQQRSVRVIDRSTKSSTPSAPAKSPSRDPYGGLLNNTNRNCPPGQETWNALCRKAKADSETVKYYADATGYVIGKALQAGSAFYKTVTKIDDAERKRAQQKRSELEEKMEGAF